MVAADLGSSVSFTVSINNQSWDRLPEEVKQAFREVAHVYADHTGRVGNADSAEGVALWRKNGEILTIPQEERVRWAAAMPNVGKQWAADLTRRGLPGDEMLTFYMDQMRANNQPIARHWDRQ
jgi:TRAP-type C4-dicarboxylate transport system substrate-binding protein